MDAYLTFLAQLGDLHKNLPPEETTPQWRSVEGSLSDLIAESMNLAAAHGHSVEACYAAFDGPDHNPLSVPA